MEYCFNVETVLPLDESEFLKLKYLLCQGFVVETITEKPQLVKNVLEVGPRLNFETSWSSNMVSICGAVGLEKVTRIEKSRRVVISNSQNPETFYDRMTEQVYQKSLTSFENDLKPERLRIVPLLENGPDELKNIEMAAFDDFERNIIYDYFANVEKRNPTYAEILDWANANSEHCRHWLFSAKWIIDGQEKAETLFQLVKKPWIENKGATLFAFDDNSGAIHGRKSKVLSPISSVGPSSFVLIDIIVHPTLTAETHNFPTGVSPNGGAETGLGGMQRDQRDVRQGAVTLANFSGYGVGSLLIPGYDLPWEDKLAPYLSKLASPLSVLIDGSSGVHHYGNESGIPLICGFVRSTDIIVNSERWAFQKPILYAGGGGLIDDNHIQKNEPQPGMIIVQVGGPAYRIGVGGGAASSKGQGDQALDLDFNAVQRGNAEMSRKVDRVVYACVSMCKNNPIVIAHDQGAGGMANAVKEAVGKAGGKIDIRKVNVGDPTMSVWEIYVAEYQERECFLILPDRLNEFLAICAREKAPCEILGEITGDGRFVVEDSLDGSTPVDIKLEAVLGDLPQKTYEDKTVEVVFPELNLKGVTIKEAIERVLKLPSVGSKRYLIKNVDRSVKGRTVQQQCCGPLQLPVSDYGLSALSHFGTNGVAYSIGERSTLMIGDPAAGARMAIVEAILNMAGANIGEIENIDCRANWMWAPKLSGEGAAMYSAAQAMSELMIILGINISGGKDSSSMYSRIEGETVKSPRELVILANAIVDDFSKKVTPDFKNNDSAILFLDLANGNRRLGGSALAQVYKQIGNEFPDLEDSDLLQNAFSFIQDLLSRELIFSCHDTVGDGLFVSLIEMAISGNIGCNIKLPAQGKALNHLFAEEAGILLEVGKDQVEKILEIASYFDLFEEIKVIGETTNLSSVVIERRQKEIFSSGLIQLRSCWEETSYHLDLQRTNPDQANQEWAMINSDTKGPYYHLSFVPQATPSSVLEKINRHKVAVLREEGTNGEDEMRSAFELAGFEVVDVNMQDLLLEKIDLSQFRGLVACGGFSYGDVPESAKGWAATIRFNKNLKKMFDDFYNRPDTFSLGVCNGCQLFALLGWAPYKGMEDGIQPRLTQNSSGIFESRYSTVRITKSPSILFKDMVDSVLGIWVAHGEGKFIFPDKYVLNSVTDNELIPLYYVDESNYPTESYPFNPNGSPYGIAGLCSKDGRHTIMMPHPERLFLLWQLPWMPKSWKKLLASPWLKMFQNAREWCDNN